METQVSLRLIRQLVLPFGRGRRTRSSRAITTSASRQDIGKANAVAGRLPMLAPSLHRRFYSRADIAVLLRYHRRLIGSLLLLGCLAGAAGGVLTGSRFTAVSLLTVSGGVDSAAAQDIAMLDGATGASVRAEIALLRSDAVAARVVRQISPAILFPDLAEPRLFGLLPPRSEAEQLARASFRLIAAISATPIPGSGIIRVSYAHPDRAVALRTLRAILDSYLTVRRTLTASATGALAHDRASIDAQLADIDQQIQKVRDDYHVTDIAPEIATAVARLDAILQHENQVRERQMVVSAELSAAQRQLGIEPQKVFDAQEHAVRPADEAHAALLSLKLEREHLVAQYSADYPALPELDRKIAAIEATLQQAAKPVLSATRDVRNPTLDVLRTRVANLQVEAAGQSQQLDELAFEYGDAVSRVANLREAETGLHDLQYQREVLEAAGRQFSVREADVRVDDAMARARQSSVHVAEAATAPMDSDSDWPLWAVGGPLAGLGLAAAAWIVAARRRRVYVVAREVERHLDLPALAEFDADDVGMDGRDSDRQLVALAALLADSRIDGRRLFAVQALSPDEPEDQHAMLQALAAELGQRHGLRTLVLDVDCAGEALPLALEGPGLPSYLPVPLAGASLQLWSDEIDVLEIDPLSGPDLTHEMLANLRQSCDMILVSAGHDASEEAARRLGSAVDANLLVLQAERTDSDEAARLSEGVQLRGGQMLGFVLTGRRVGAHNW